MNLKNFQQEISRIILQRGKDYYNEGAVIDLEEDEESGLWNAQVEGSETYQVEVQLGENGEIDAFFCDCPHDADVCKHIVAVFYELKDKVKTIKLNPAKTKADALSFGELLQKVTLSQLREFVKLYAQDDKNFKIQFELHFANKDEKVDVEKKYTDLVKKAIRSGMSHGFVDYYSSGDLSGKVDAFLEKAWEAVEKQDFKDASNIARVVLKQLINDVIPNADDSDGVIGDSITDAISILSTIVESELSTRELKENIHDFLANELTNENYFDYGDFGEECFEIFRYLSVQLNRTEAFLALSYRPGRKRTELWADNYQAEYFIKQTILFFKEIGNEVEAEKLIRQHMDIVEVRQGVVEEAIDRKEYAEAKELIYQGIVLAQKREHPGTISEWQKMLLRIADLEGDLVMQRHFNLLFAFEYGFNPEYYKNWKKTFPQTQWETEFEGLIRKMVNEIELEAEKRLDNHWWSKSSAMLDKLAPVYVEEKQWDKLYQLVEGYPNLEALLNYMKYLAKDYQPEITDLLYPALLIAGDRADSRSGYAKIASYMVQIMRFMPASRGRMLEAAQVLRTKYRRRSAMLDELKVVK